MALRLGLWHGATLLCVFINPAFAKDLSSITQLALDNAPVLKQAHYQHDATQQALPNARAALLPEIEINASKRQQHNQANTHSYSLDLNQAIYNPVAYLQIDYARDQISHSQWQLIDTQQQLILRTAEIYFSILSARDSLRLKQSEKNALQKQLEQITLQFEAGLSARTDLYEIQARFDLINAEELTAQDELADHHESLLELTNQRLIIDPINPERFIHFLDKKELSWWNEQSLEYNPGYQMARIETALAKNEVKQQRAGHKPSIDLLARKGQSSFRNDEEDIESLTLQLSMPIFSGGLTTAKTQESIYYHQAKLQQLEQQRRSLLRQIRNSFRAIQTGIRHLKALKQAIASSQLALTAARTGQIVGSRTIVDVLNAQQSTFLTQRDYSQAGYQHIMLQLKLKYLTGQLQLDTIKQLSQQ